MSYEIVKKLIGYGCHITPLKPRTKKPYLPEWPQYLLSQDEISDYFRDGRNTNVGVVLGDNSNGIVDVDLDTDSAVEVAPFLLPDTGSIFGHLSRPLSHRIYRVPDAERKLVLSHPESGENIVELRGNGHQTMFPGSMHPDGEEVRFEDGKDFEPSNSDWRTLVLGCRHVGVAVLLYDAWIIKNRHKLSLAFGGFCAANHVPQADCERIIEAVCVVRNDEDRDDRVACIATSYDRHGRDENVTGISLLTQILGGKVSEKIRDWMTVPKAEAVVAAPGHLTRMPADLSTELSASESFCEWMLDSLLYSGRDDCFYRRDKGVYDAVKQEQALQSVIEFVKKQSENPTSFEEQRTYKNLQSKAKLNAILELSKTKLFVNADKFDSDPFLVGCSNGVLNIATRQLVKPEIVVTKRLGTLFDEAARCPRFETFISQIMGGDEELIAYVRRAVGYSLSGLVTEQCMFVGIGSGANGKSTFQKIVQALMGDYTASTPMNALMSSRNGNDKTDDLANLPGKRFVCAQEGESSQSLAVAKIKLMTGNDKISCRRLYGNLFEYDPEFKLWLFTNELPRIPGGDAALWRRVHVVPFAVTIPVSERDANLGNLMIDELPGILNWALDGFADFEKLGGLFPPISVVNATSGYRNESDVVQQFVGSCCHITNDPSDATMMSDLYHRYEEWSHNSALEPASKVTFGKDLNRLGFRLKKGNKGNGRRGILLRKFA